MVLRFEVRNSKKKGIKKEKEGGKPPNCSEKKGKNG